MLDTSSPLFIELLLWTIYALLAVAVGITVWSVLRTMKKQGPSERYSNGIAVRRIAWGTAAVLVVLLALTFLTGSTEPLIINGRPYNDTFWLRTCDMLINTALALIVIAVICVTYSTFRLYRRH
jgi:cobalamin synthase